MGIQVKVMLLFSLGHYLATAEAFVHGAYCRTLTSQREPESECQSDAFCAR